MSRVAVITDSNSGITQQQAAELGLYVLPMPFTINDETYHEGKNLTLEEFYEKLGDKEAKIFTSQPSIEEVTSLWDKVLKDYDQIVHMPMSSGLSSSCQTAMMLAEEEYAGKVFVVNNQRISVTQRQSAIDALTLAQQGKDGAEIKEILEREKFESSIYIMLDTLVYLKRGGRITPAAAALGNLLKLKPVLQIQGEKLDAFAKCRTIKQAKGIMIEAIQKDIEERFGGIENVGIYIAHTQNLSEAEAFREEILQTFPGQEIYIDQLPMSISCHIGPGSLAFACSKHIPS